MRRLLLGCCVALAYAGVGHAEPKALHDMDVVVDRVLVAGSEATLYVAVRGAVDLDESHAVAGAAVEVILGSAYRTTAITDAAGQALIRLRVPRGRNGDQDLIVHSHSPLGDATLVRKVTIVDQRHVHLRTDRGEYQPGQQVRWRAVLQNGVDAHPLDGQVIEVALADPRGTEVWRGVVKTGRTGMASGAVPLGDDLVTGTYTLRAASGSATTSETVSVRAVELPPFFVRIEADAPGPLPPGGRFSGHVVAALPYGEPVQGKLAVTIDPGDGSEERQDGELDANGRRALRFEGAGSGAAHISAVVTDGAGRHGRAALDVGRPGDGLEMAFITEGNHAAPGAPLAVTIVTSDGEGAFVPAQVFVKVPGLPRRVAQLSRGAVRLELPIPASARGTLHLEAGAVASDGRVASETSDVEVSAAEPRALRLAEAVLAAGEPVRLGGSWTQPRGPVVATLIGHGAPLASAIATVDGAGRLSATLTPPTGAFGLATVRVTEIAWNRETGALEPATERAPVYLLPASLDVRVEAELRHEPGADATFAVTVRDAAGRPAAGVGLSAAVVDERILALSTPRPDLPAVLRGLGLDSARAAGLLFADLAIARPDAVTRAALRAIIEALPPGTDVPIFHVAAAERLAAELDRVGKLAGAVYDVLYREAAPLGRPDGAGGWEFVTPLPALAQRTRIPPLEQQTPWSRGTDWPYARRLVPELTFARIADRIVEQRVDELDTLLYRRRGSLRARLRRDPSQLAGVVPAHLMLDPWGTPVRLSVGWSVDVAYAGPDRAFGTKDDVARADVFDEHGLAGHGSGTGASYGIGSGSGDLRGRRARSPSVMMGSASAREETIRERFDETVLWVAGVETDAAGKATLPVPLADSITGWEIAVEAVSPDGAVGAGKGRLETFLPLHVDADLPAELTVGDLYTVPVVVANHTDQERRLGVSFATEAGLELAGAADRQITLPAGATGAVAFPVRATAAGEARVLVRLHDGDQALGPRRALRAPWREAQGGSRSATRFTLLDAARRPVRIEPPGSLVRLAGTVPLRDGTARHEIEVAADAAPGSVSGRLRVFRGAADLSMDGLEGMLREPHGCFEQTSSTTYPNLLVLSLMPRDELHAAARARATELVAKGYQRLLSYEVRGGGFSWFGESPANQVLTAYGLLEFADMARVYPVDPAMVLRTRAWLLGKQRPDGSWAPDAHWLHDWSEVQGKVSTTAYVAWTLAESGYRGRELDRALAFLRAHRGQLAGDPYLLAVWSAAESAAGGHGPSAAAALRARAVKDGAGLVLRAGAERTIFDASGRGADVQVTALAATVFARGRAPADARAALAWLWSSRSPSHGWGSTQSDVLALRAAAIATPPAPPPIGKIRVRIDGRDAGAIDLASVDVPTLALPAGLAPGSHTVELAGDAALALDTELRLTWRTAAAPRASAHGLEVTLAAPASAVARGEVAPFVVRVRNPATDAVAMPTVVVPVPPGFRADRESLQKLVVERRIARFEDTGSELHLYLTRLGPSATVELPYGLAAEAECRVAQRPAQAYAYYDSEVRGASAGAVVEGKR